MDGGWLTARPNGKWGVCLQTGRAQVAGALAEYSREVQRDVLVYGCAITIAEHVHKLGSRVSANGRQVRRGRADPRTLKAAKMAAEIVFTALLTRRELRCVED